MKAKIGDVVQLKSGGGPKMTVGSSFAGSELNYCHWFDKNDFLHTELLSLDELEVANALEEAVKDTKK